VTWLNHLKAKIWRDVAGAGVAAGGILARLRRRTESGEESVQAWQPAANEMTESESSARIGEKRREKASGSGGGENDAAAAARWRQNQ